MARHQSLFFRGVVILFFIRIDIFVRREKANLDQLKVGVKAGHFGLDPPDMGPHISRLVESQMPGDFRGGRCFLAIMKLEHPPLLVAEAPDNFGVKGELIPRDGLDGVRGVGRGALLVLLSPAVLKWHHPVHDGAQQNTESGMLILY